MSNKRGQWIARRGQANAAAAIDQVIDQQPQPGERVQEVPDALIEDSPYQARQSLDEQSLEELAQGMREAGFQGVLIVRPHSDPVQRRRGAFQLLYGHRRRVAWRRVCTERGEHCLLPAVVREVSDEQMLTIGAQENLQRQDLDPVEEAQLVAWHQQMFSNKNQSEIGAMLGKSSDWVSVRARIHKLPDTLKERLRQRPQAIGQLLELGMLYTQQPETALALAERVVRENVTVVALRTLIRDAKQLVQRSPAREVSHNCRANATSVQDITTESHLPPAATPRNQTPKQLDAQSAPPHRTEPQLSGVTTRDDSRGSRTVQLLRGSIEADETEQAVRNLLLLQEAATVLASLASGLDTLPTGAATDRALNQVEQALRVLRRMLTHYAH
ncbi:MAG: ParB/RepB/Spo0J family partition protein [Roseiflexaceae bacterium]